MAAVAEPQTIPANTSEPRPPIYVLLIFKSFCTLMRAAGMAPWSRFISVFRKKVHVNTM